MRQLFKLVSISCALSSVACSNNNRSGNSAAPTKVASSIPDQTTKNGEKFEIFLTALGGTKDEKESILKRGLKTNPSALLGSQSVRVLKSLTEGNYEFQMYVRGPRIGMMSPPRFVDNSYVKDIPCEVSQDLREFKCSLIKKDSKGETYNYIVELDVKEGTLSYGVDDRAAASLAQPSKMKTMSGLGILIDYFPN